jgi:tetratricopeptide (TPR) repeat protein
MEPKDSSVKKFFLDNKKVVLAVCAAVVLIGATVIAINVREQRLQEAQEKAYTTGASAYSEGKFDKAITELEKAKELAPGDAKTHLNLAQSYEAKGELDKALVEYKASVAAEPKQPEALYNMAIIYRSQGDMPNAIQSLETAVATNKEFVAARIALGDLYGITGKSDKAKEQYEAVIGLKPYGVNLEDIKQKIRVLK